MLGCPIMSLIHIIAFGGGTGLRVLLGGLPRPLERRVTPRSKP
jgi:hypothetical protein